MSYRALTVEEENYLDRGGRVFLVSDENEVVILRKGAEPYVMGNGAGEVYRFPDEGVAIKNAWLTACLSEDKPMVEGVIVGVLANPPSRTLRA